jgi:hypothetical protein
MTREFSSLSSPLAFLDSKFAMKEDASLISQVEIWSINSRIFDTFGVDPELKVENRLLPQFRRLNIALETWRADWSDRFDVDETISGHFQTAVDLQFYFSKLYLCSHVFRGPKPQNEARQISPDMEEFANSAIDSAAHIVCAIAIDQGIQSSLANLTTYFHTMLAFAAVFLLKMVRQGPLNIKTDKEEIFGLIDQLLTVLVSITAEVHSHHLLYSLASSIQRLMQTTQHSQATPGVTAGETVLMNNDTSPMPSLDLLGNYDFLWPQNADFDLDFFEPSNMPI